MWRLLIISVLFLVCVAESFDGTFLHRSVQICDEEHELDRRCSEDCQTIELCSAKITSRYSYSWEPYLQCPDDQVCNDGKGKVICSKKDEEGACTKKRDKVLCNESGVYPHPLYCDKYIICDVEEKSNTILSCPQGFMYSACTKNCDWKFDDTECNSTEIDCNNKLGMKFEVYSNERIYYKCEYDSGTYFPVFYNCPKGTTFTDGECKDHIKPGCGIE